MLPLLCAKAFSTGCKPKEGLKILLMPMNVFNDIIWVIIYL